MMSLIFFYYLPVKQFDLNSRCYAIYFDYAVFISPANANERKSRGRQISYSTYGFIFTRYVAQYNDIPSPLSNAEKLAESSRREEELRRERERERDEASKAYHERESRVPMTAQQRKGVYKLHYLNHTEYNNIRYLTIFVVQKSRGSH